MSLILDALNRARREDAAVPGLDTHHPVRTQPRKLGRYLPWIALALAALLIIWLLLERDQASTPAEVAPLDEVADNLGSALSSVQGQLQSRGEAKTRAEVASPRMTPGPEATAAVQRAGPAGGASAQGGSPEAPVPAPSATRSAAQATDQRPGDAVASSPEDGSESPTDPAVAALYQRPPEEAPRTKPPTKPAANTTSQPTSELTTMTDRDTEEPVDIERMLVQARDEVENAQLVEHPAPFLAALSQQTKNDIPSIYYQRHDYAESAARSSVVLNNQTLRVGGSPLSGMRVEEILPDSVILSYRDTQFRLRALNSWINL